MPEIIASKPTTVWVAHHRKSLDGVGDVHNHTRVYPVFFEK